MSTNVIKKKMTRVLIFDVGKRARYEPMTAAMAPEAPIVGTKAFVGLREKAMCERLAITPPVM